MLDCSTGPAWLTVGASKPTGHPDLLYFGNALQFKGSNNSFHGADVFNQHVSFLLPPLQLSGGRREGGPETSAPNI